MLVIRFQRVGRKNDPAFRVVVTEKRSKPKSGEHEILGSFHPKTKETHLKRERILYWLSQGAKLSPRVHNLLIREGVITGKKIDVAKHPVTTPPPEMPVSGSKESEAPAAEAQAAELEPVAATPTVDTNPDSQ